MSDEKIKPYNTYTRFLHVSRPLNIKFPLAALDEVKAAASAQRVPLARFVREAALKEAQRVNESAS